MHETEARRINRRMRREGLVELIDFVMKEIMSISLHLIKPFF